MNIKILKEDKDHIEIEIKGQNHTFCNALKNKLWEDKHVKVAGYRIAHPLIGVPTLSIETDGTKPRKVLSDAAKGLIKDLDDFKSAFNKGVKL